MTGAGTDAAGASCCNDATGSFGTVGARDRLERLGVLTGGACRRGCAWTPATTVSRISSATVSGCASGDGARPPMPGSQAAAAACSAHEAPSAIAKGVSILRKDAVYTARPYERMLYMRPKDQ